jgi:hypothetical protein
MTAIFKQDCSDSFNNAVSDKFFCASASASAEPNSVNCEVFDYQHCEHCFEENCHQRHGEIIMSFEEHQNKKTPVIIGLLSANRNFNNTLPLVFLKISAYHDWIEKIFKIDEHLLFGY